MLLFHKLSPVIGGLLMALVLLDVFLTVLYARIGSGFLSHLVARLMWRIFRRVSTWMQRWRDPFLSFCGPCILVAIMVVWVSGLVVGSAMVIWPKLGTSIRTTGGATPTDFVAALYVAGDSMTTVGTSDLTPQTAPMRLFYMFNSFIGISCLTLMVTYLLEIYNALQRRNTFAVKLHMLTAETGDAASMVAMLGPDGRFDIGYAHLVEIAAEMVNVEESHHFYSALFYFRFREPHYALSRITLTALDAVTLIKSGLNDEEYGWLKKSAAVEQIWRSSMQLMSLLTTSFLPDRLPDAKVPPNTSSHDQWEARYRAAIDQLEQAGVKVLDPLDDGPEIYVSLRTKWDPYIRRFAEHMGQDLRNIDLAMFPGESAPSRVPTLHATG